MKSQNDTTQSPLLFVCAHPHEAAPLVETLKLRKVHGSHPVERHLQLFRSDSAYVAVTGIGKLRAAAAVGSLLAYLPVQPALLCNIGLAGSTSQDDLKKAFLIHKIEDADSGAVFIPDIVFSHPFEERSLQTVARPLFSQEHISSTTPVLVDMEAAALFQAALPFLPCDKLLFLKVVSDNLEKTVLTKQRIHALLSPAVTPLISLAQEWAAAGGETLTQELSRVSSYAEAYFALSFTQKKQIEQLYREWYAHTGNSSEEFLDHLKRVPPPESKQQRTAGLTQFRSIIQKTYRHS